MNTIFYRKFFLLILALVIFSPVFCQTFKGYSLSVMTETMSFPFTRYLPIHPGLEVGVVHYEKQQKLLAHQVSYYLGAYHHKKVENGLYIRGEYVLRYIGLSNLAIDLPVGIGYQQSFYPGETYTQNKESGDWESGKFYTKPHALVTFGLGFHYTAWEIQPFIKQESFIDIPLSSADFLNTRTHVKLGIVYKLNTQ